jgi:pimeloyl-ACP methyl ester carboxylesterase
MSRGGAHIAYQIVGDGPIDVIAVPGFVSHLDMWWDAPTDHLVRGLASYSRLILFDKRGMGLSDRPPHIDIEDWVEDTRAVLDAAGSERAVLLGISAGAPTAARFAAEHPERVSSLILYGGYPRFLSGEGYEFGFDAAVADAFIDHMQANWGTGVGLALLAPSRADDPVALEFWARLQTTSASPGAAATFLRALARVDVRDVLPTLQMPTLILHAERDQNTPIEGARLSRDLIPGARLVELDSDIHLIWVSDVIGEVTAEIEAFICPPVPASDVDGTLATVLAVELQGHARRHLPAVTAGIERGGGRPTRTPGVATFDGPARAIRCALALLAEVGERDRQLRIAVHCGECQFVDDNVRGVAVSLVHQLAATAEPGEVLVSQTVRDLIVGSAIELEPRGPASFDGVPGKWDVFAVLAAPR